MKKLFVMVIAIVFLIMGIFVFQSCQSRSVDEKNINKPAEGESGAKTDQVSNAEILSTPSQTSTNFEEKNAGAGDKTTATYQSRADDKVPAEQKKSEKIPAKIIKTADAAFQVKNCDESRKAIIDIVKKSGGYVSSENQTNNNYQIENTMIIRMKSDGFDTMLDLILKQSIYTESKKIVADDVTADYVDIQARLQSKKEVEKQYAEILKKAYTIYDILQVEQQLRQIREEIDAFEGKLKYFDDRVDYSTINLRFYEKLDYTPSPSANSGFFYKLGKAFAGGWHIILTIIIGLAYMWPFIIALGVGLFFLIRYIKKGKKTKP